MHQTPERALVGDVIESPGVIHSVRQIVPSGEWFADRQAAILYDIVLSVFDDCGEIDLAAMNPRLSRAGVDPALILACSGMANSTLAEHHARKVAEEHMRRQTAATLSQVQKELATGEDIVDVIDTSVATLTGLKRTFDQGKTIHVSHVVAEAVKELEEIFSGQKTMGIPFGFPDIDHHTGGMDNGDMVVIAAAEKSGKSTLMIQVVFNILARGIPCVIFSTEMTRRQILYRKALMDTRIRWIDVKNNRCTQEEMERLYNRLRELGSLPLFIRQGAMTIFDIVADTDRFVRERGVKLVAVDYIQRVVPVSKRSNENREREVAAISSGLKNVALEHNIPVLVLSQVNDDLRARESRAIEHDMDKMITLDRKPEPAAGARGVMVNLQLRQRMGLSGNMGDVQLWYDLMHGTWANAATQMPGLQKTGMPF